MKLNDYAPKTIRIDPQTFDVFIDDELVTCEPIHTTSLSQRYFLFLGKRYIHEAGIFPPTSFVFYSHNVFSTLLGCYMSLMLDF